MNPTTTLPASSPARLIVLNGPAGIGKNTIARRFIADHPLTLCLDGDALIGMIGDWINQEDTARQYVYGFTATIASMHLQRGHDVILPYLILEPAQAEAFAAIAQTTGSRLIEVALWTEKPEALQRLYARGSWGEPGAPALTQADVPIAEELYDRMVRTLQGRPQTAVIRSVNGDIEGTYRQLLSAIGG